MGDLTTPCRYKPDPGTTENPSFTVGGCAYEDEEQTRFAFICSSEGFGLPSFDDFIDNLPEGIAKEELLDWRKNAFNAFKNSNRAALRGWLQAAYSNWRARLTIDGIRPTLSLGLKYSASQSQKGKEGAEKRWAISDNGEAMADIINELAL